MGNRILIYVHWNQPQVCGDCRIEVPDGWQELKTSEGGPYLEKRCGPCAEVHYGDALPELVNDISKAKRNSGRNKAADEPMIPAPLLGLAG